MPSPPHHDHNIPNYVIEDTCDELLDDPWPFLQETDMDLVGMEQYGLDSSIFLDQEEHVPLMADLSIFEEERSVQQDDHHDPAISTAEADQPSSSSKKGKRNHRFKCVQTDHNIEDDDQVEPLVPIADRNAKERVRRMKLNASYLSLGALLPDPRRLKKRWSAPIIIDKVVEYIPELENEIQKLTLKKQNMLTVIGNNNKNLLLGQHDDHDIVQAPSVMVHSVKRGEMIVQICMNIGRRSHDGGENDPNYSLSSIVHKVEQELGMCVLDASSVSLSDHRLFTYHIHIQMVNGGSDGDEYNNVEALRAKVMSWLVT